MYNKTTTQKTSAYSIQGACTEHRLQTLRNAIGNTVSIPIQCNVSSSFCMNMIKFVRTLWRDGEETGIIRDNKGRKKQIMIVKFVGKLFLTCLFGSASKRASFFKNVMPYTMVKNRDLVLHANRKCNFCADYCGNAKQV